MKQCLILAVVVVTRQLQICHFSNDSERKHNCYGQTTLVMLVNLYCYLYGIIGCEKFKIFFFTYVTFWGLGDAYFSAT